MNSQAAQKVVLDPFLTVPLHLHLGLRQERVVLRLVNRLTALAASRVQSTPNGLAGPRLVRDRSAQYAVFSEFIALNDKLLKLASLSHSNGPQAFKKRSMRGWKAARKRRRR